ncbi:hypothetical protein [Bacteroides sp.]
MEYTKFFKYVLFATFVVGSMNSCTEDDIEFTKFPQPDWKVDMNGYVDAPNWSVVEQGTATAPEWQLNLAGSDEQPMWEKTDAGDFQFSMAAVIGLSDFLEKYAAEGDQLAAFIGDECRGIGTPEIVKNKKTYFIYIRGNNSEAHQVTLKYYSAENNTIYQCKDLFRFTQNGVYGTAAHPEIPSFELSGKYPYAMTATVSLPEELVKQVGERDRLAVFCGTDCRGVGEEIEISAGQKAYRLEVRGTNEAEQQLYFKYYCAANKMIYKGTERFSFSKDGNYGNASDPKVISMLPEKSMTAAVCLPEELLPYTSEQDEVAAFVGNECCGVGQLAYYNGKAYYKLLLRTTLGNGAALSFRYYSARNTYMYETPTLVEFMEETAFGTEDNPQILPISMQGKYPLKMTAVVTLPENIAAYMQDNDLLGAFVDGECRGLGKRKLNQAGTPVYELSIIGPNKEGQNICFRYYSARNSYMYEDNTPVKFNPASQYGTEEQAIVLNLRNLE